MFGQSFGSASNQQRGAGMNAAPQTWVTPKGLGKGMWVMGRLTEADDPQAMLDRARSCNLKWLVIEVQNSSGLRVNPREMLDRYLSVLQQQVTGFFLWGWVTPSTVDTFIGRAVMAATEIGAQGVIVDAEDDWRWRSGNAADEHLKRQAAARLAAGLTRVAHAANVSVGITSYSLPELHPRFPWREFSQMDFGMPQIYNLGNQYRPEQLDIYRASPAQWKAHGFNEIVPISSVINKTRQQMRDLLANTPITSGAISWWEWRGAKANAHEAWRAIREYIVPNP